MDFKNSDQLKSYLKKESERLNISITNVYNTFFSRLLLERLQKYNLSNIIVKGSFAQLVHLGKIVRPITDVDITTRGTHREPLIELISAMCDDETDNISYEFNRKPKVTNTGIFKIGLKANFGKISHPLGIDYRENHPCIYEIEKKEVPKIFTKDDTYRVLVPSIEETLAEKLCIIAESNKPNIPNTRVKDFYDIYQLHGGNYDLEKFSFYFEKMLNDRGKVNISSVSTEMLSKKFIEEHQKYWDESKKSYEFLDNEIDLDGAVYYTRGVLSEQLQKIRMGKNKVYKI